MGAHMVTYTRLLLGSLLFCVLAACGDDTGDDGDAGTKQDRPHDGDHDAGTDGGKQTDVDAGEVDTSDPKESLSLATVCEWIESEAERAPCDDQDPDVESCRAIIQQRVDACTGLISAVVMGRVTYDPKAAKRCADQNQGGIDSSTLLSSCPDVFRGLVEDGEPCFYDYAFEASECLPGSYCTPSFECPSTCHSFVGLGEACDESYCTAGLTCVKANGKYTCMPPLPNGATCERGEDCESFYCDEGECGVPENECEEQSDCGPGRGCFTGDDELTFCGKIAKDGDPCPDWGCPPDHHCHDEGEQGAICRADLERDEECEAPLEIGGYNSPCKSPLVCMISSTGTCLPPGREGEPCDVHDADSCEEGLWCDGAMGSICQPPAELGGACNPAFWTPCTEGFCKCTGDDTGDTANGLSACVEGECVPQSQLTQLGEPCKRADECASSFCEIWRDKPVCGVPLSLQPACIPREE